MYKSRKSLFNNENEFMKQLTGVIMNEIKSNNIGDNDNIARKSS
jgi:hypothetical protein